MEVLEEITKWDVPTRNHTYILNDAGKCAAYKKQGTEVWEIMQKPLFFTKSYRKFKKLEFPEELVDVL